MYDIETRFTVKSLKALCGALGAPVSGAKGVLQQRLRALLLRILNNQDTVLFNMGKTAAETERGTSYNASRLQRYRIFGSERVDCSRPNGFHPVSSTGATASTSQGNNWGMSSLYNNVRLRKLPSRSIDLTVCSRLQKVTFLQYFDQHNSRIHHSRYPPLYHSSSLT